MGGRLALFFLLAPLCLALWVTFSRDYIAPLVLEDEHLANVSTGPPFGESCYDVFNVSRTLLTTNPVVAAFRQLWEHPTLANVAAIPFVMPQLLLMFPLICVLLVYMHTWPIVWLASQPVELLRLSFLRPLVAAIMAYWSLKALDMLIRGNHGISQSVFGFFVTKPVIMTQHISTGGGGGGVPVSSSTNQQPAVPKPRPAPVVPRFTPPSAALSPSRMSSGSLSPRGKLQPALKMRVKEF